MKAYLAQVRRTMNNQAVLRFETEPGRRAQVDWKEFGKQWVDGHETKLYAFVMVLGYSRMPFIRFTTDMKQSTLLACHTLAFAHFGGVPKEILYDNMRTAFEPNGEGVWHPTRRLAACAVHYGFVPQRCRVRRPETKGKVERLIGYLDRNFSPELKRSCPIRLMRSMRKCWTGSTKSVQSLWKNCRNREVYALNKKTTAERASGGLF